MLTLRLLYTVACAVSIVWHASLHCLPRKTWKGSTATAPAICVHYMHNQLGAAADMHGVGIAWLVVITRHVMLWQHGVWLVTDAIVLHFWSAVWGFVVYQVLGYTGLQ
jgi:hypothetical protein